MGYNFTAIEKEMAAALAGEQDLCRAWIQSDAPGMRKAYILDMFPLPQRGWVCTWGIRRGYTATDIVSAGICGRQGYNVLHPMGWDAFGSAGRAVRHQERRPPRRSPPKEHRHASAGRFRSLGLSYDWDREVDTTDPAYYKWTQWIFLQLFNSYFDPVD